ncbi:MAG: cytochrome c biogenesis protein CcsA [Acidimicrobiales bacterium]|nr:cytochrome c biogenesis protein CcsA [Acidimicrobiales bacterium]
MVANGALVVSVLAATATIVAGFGGNRTARWSSGALATTAAALVVATVRLSVAFWQSDFAFEYVAGHSRRGVAGPYRVAGLWGGLGGSLLLWVTLLAVVALVALRRPAERAVAAAFVAPVTMVVVTLVNPFERFALPAFAGSGLTPILEHPAMVYHPPLLYLGLVATVVPFAQVVAGGRASRRSLFAAWGLLTAGLATGANWAYVELGWGGYWAWDPVENSALVPWLLVVAALHWSRRSERALDDRVGRAMSASPFVLVLFGAVLTRSGATASVHAFGQQEAVGWALGGVTVLAAGLVVVRVRRGGVGRSHPAVAARWLAVATVGAVVAAVVVFVGTAQPIVWRWLGGTARVVEGQFFAQLLAPLAIGALVFGSYAPGGPRSTAPAAVGALGGLAVGIVLGALDLSVAGLAAGAMFAGTGAVLAAMAHLTVRSPDRGRIAPPVVLGHVGFAVLLFGVAGTIGADELAVRLDPGESVELAGRTFTHIGVVGESRDDLLGGTVTAAIDVDGRRFAPSLVSYPDAGVLLAETALHSTPAADVQIVLRNAGDAGWADYDLAVRPLAMWVWWGSALLVLTAAVGLWSLRLADASTGPDAPKPPDGARPDRGAGAARGQL